MIRTYEQFMGQAAFQAHRRVDATWVPREGQQAAGLLLLRLVPGHLGDESGENSMKDKHDSLWSGTSLRLRLKRLDQDGRVGSAVRDASELRRGSCCFELCPGTVPGSRAHTRGAPGDGPEPAFPPHAPPASPRAPFKMTAQGGVREESATAPSHLRGKAPVALLLPPAHS